MLFPLIYQLDVTRQTSILSAIKMRKALRFSFGVFHPRCMVTGCFGENSKKKGAQEKEHTIDLSFQATFVTNRGHGVFIFVEYFE